MRQGGSCLSLGQIKQNRVAIEDDSTVVNNRWDLTIRIERKIFRRQIFVLPQIDVAADKRETFLSEAQADLLAAGRSVGVVELDHCCFSPGPHQSGCKYAVN